VHEPTQVEGAGEGDDLVSDLVDLTDLPLEQLRVSGDTALAHALRRVIDDVSDPDGTIAGFQSAL
jgi:FXSXX-COOH protein